MPRPEPYSLVLPNHIPSRMITLANLISIGLLFLVEVVRPSLGQRLMSFVVKSRPLKQCESVSTTMSVAFSSLVSSTPCRSKIFRRPCISILSILRDRASTWPCSCCRAWFTKAPNAVNSVDKLVTLTKETDDLLSC